MNLPEYMFVSIAGSSDVVEICRLGIRTKSNEERLTLGWVINDNPTDEKDALKEN